MVWISQGVIPPVYRTEGVFLVTSDPNRKQDLEPWVVALRNQAHWNAAGAICAALAVGLDAAKTAWSDSPNPSLLCERGP